MATTTINRLIVTSSIIAVILSACTGQKKVVKIENQVVSIATDNQWTLVPTPNTLDDAGVIIAIDKKGVQTAIPNGRLDIKKDPGTIMVPQVTKVDNANLGILASFLSAGNTDSIAKAAIYDSAKFTATFAVSKGVYTRLVGDLPTAFEAKKESLQKTLKLLDLEESKIYLILETISSDSIKVVIDNYNHAGVDVLAKINNWLNLHPSAGKQTSVNKNLIYQAANSPLIVLYKLRQINVAMTGKRGQYQKVEATLGAPVTTALVTQ